MGTLGSPKMNMKKYLPLFRRIFLNSITKKFLWGIIVINILFITATVIMIHYQSQIIQLKAEDNLILSDIRNLIVLIATIASLLAIMISLYISYSITRPIHQLVLATELLKKGEYAQLDIRTSDEIGTLSETFNKTSKALNRLEQERRNLEEVKKEFLSILSHELRSPMTPMKAQLQMLLEGYFGRFNREQKDAIETILRNTNRLDTIISELLELSRIESAHLTFNFVKTDLKAEILRLAEEMKNYAREKRIKIETKISNIPVVEIDPDRVIQVLRNLLSNAIKFSRQNGTVEIAAYLKGSYIQFSVKDHGIGISEQNQQQLFAPFFQADKSLNRKYGGVGLGLAICKGIVEAQNGKIWVKSKLGKGATFYFTVPSKPVRISKLIKMLFGKKEQ